MPSISETGLAPGWQDSRLRDVCQVKCSGRIWEPGILRFNTFGAYEMYSGGSFAMWVKCAILLQPCGRYGTSHEGAHERTRLNLT